MTCGVTVSDDLLWSHCAVSGPGPGLDKSKNKWSASGNGMLVHLLSIHVELPNILLQFAHSDHKNR